MVLLFESLGGGWSCKPSQLALIYIWVGILRRHHVLRRVDNTEQQASGGPQTFASRVAGPTGRPPIYAWYGHFPENGNSCWVVIQREREFLHEPNGNHGRGMLIYLQRYTAIRMERHFDMPKMVGKGGSCGVPFQFQPRQLFVALCPCHTSASLGHLSGELTQETAVVAAAR